MSFYFYHHIFMKIYFSDNTMIKWIRAKDVAKKDEFPVKKPAQLSECK